MRLLRTLGSLRRDAMQLALHTLGLRQPQGGRKAGAPHIYPLTSTPRFNAPAVHTPEPHASMWTPTALTVRERVRETRDAISLVLAHPDGRPMAFLPGMFFTVVVEVDGQEYRRAYSVSSAAQQPDTATITIKRVAHGKVSNWLCEHIQAKDTLRVLGPSGSFTIDPANGAPAHLLLVGAGSGITPLMSIIRTLLAQQPHTRIQLVYGNRRVGDIIFRQALDQLVQQYGERLHVTHVLEQAPRTWSGETGRLDRSTLGGVLDRMGIITATLSGMEVFTCGPQPVMEAVAQEMQARGVPVERLHQERFSTSERSTDASPLAPQPVQARLNGQTWSATVQPGQTLLEAGLEAGAPMPYSCTLGGCGRCRVRLNTGTVEMAEPNCLLPTERAQNYALACIAYPCSAVQFEIDPPATH